MPHVTPDRARLWLWAALALTAAKLWLTAAQPIFAIGPAGYDDALFLQLAESIRHGDWLGDYTHLTLAKGPFYPLWIAGVHLLGIPLFFSQHVFYAACCAALVRACRPALAAPAARFGFYALLLWNPMTFDASSLGRVLRQQLYAPMTLLLFAGLAALYFRRHESTRRQLPWAVGLGLAFGAFYLTREETIWIAPSLALLTLAVLVGAWRESRATLVRSGGILGVATLCALLPLLVVSALNSRYYGWFGTVEFRDSAFKDAYGAMVRVRAGPEIARIPAPRQAREAAYAVSPTFAQLQPHLEGDIGRNWAKISVAITGIPPEERQIGSGWLMWALRDAVHAAGHAHSAGEAHAFYRAMADEINAACDAGKIPAGPPRSGFMPVWHEGEKLAVLGTALEFADFTVSFRRFSAHTPPSEGGEESLAIFRRMTGGQLAPSADAPRPEDLRVTLLHRIGKVLRSVLFWLFVGAQIVAAIRVVQLVRRRQCTFPLTLAAAAWGGGVTYLLIQAIIHVTSFPVLVIASFASVYPLIALFIGAVAWDAAAAWWPANGSAATTPVAAQSVQPGPVAAPAPVIADAPWKRRLPWALGALALAPLLLCYRQFAELFWFADDLFLVDEIAKMGFGPWIGEFFTESFVPLFKLLWGGALQAGGGSYVTMIWLLWLTHALNAALFARLLLRAGFAWPAAVAAPLVFALTSGNLESLGWSVQWSALLATLFLLLGLLWHENNNTDESWWSWRAHAPLVLCAAASACCFARGVLTGGVLALALLLPGVLAGDWRAALRRLPAALLCLVPALVVALVILCSSHGNPQHMAGHWGEALRFAFTFLLLSPGFLLGGQPELTPASVLLLAGLKIAIVGWGLARSRGRIRVLLLALLAYDAGNAILLGIGRYHTGLLSALGPRYLYSSLIATLPFAGLALTWLLARVVPNIRLRHLLAGTVLALLVWHQLRSWPAALEPFAAWRGTEMRQLMQAPYTDDPAATVPALDFMHLERAKALQRAYDLH